MTSIRYPGEFNEIISNKEVWNKLKCDCKFCKIQPYEKNEQALPDKNLVVLHTLNWKNKITTEYKKYNKEGKSKLIKELLLSAIDNHRYIESKIRNDLLEGKSGRDHVRSWLDYLD